MSWILCCCGSKPTNETGAAEADRQDAAQLEERVRGERDSASTLVNAEPRQESDLVSIAKSEEAAATELCGTLQMPKSPTEHRSSFINTEVHKEYDLIPPNLLQECDIVLEAASPASSSDDEEDEEADEDNECGDLSNNNNNRYRNGNRPDSSSRRPKTNREKEDELQEGIFKEINLRRSEMNKPAFKLCDDLSYSARYLYLDPSKTRIKPEKFAGRFLQTKLRRSPDLFTCGCFFFEISAKNAILSELPRFVVDQWCPTSMAETSASETQPAEIGPMLQNNKDLFGDPVDSAMSLMMNSKYERVGVFAGVITCTSSESASYIGGMVLFAHSQVGWYTILTMRKSMLLRVRNCLPDAYMNIYGSELSEWSNSVAEQFLSEAIHSLEKHAEQVVDSTVREPRTMARPLLAESTRRIKEAEQLRACVNLIPDKFCESLVQFLMNLATHLRALGNQLAELAGAADRNALSQRQIYQRLQELIDQMKANQESVRNSKLPTKY